MSARASGVAISKTVYPSLFCRLLIGNWLKKKCTSSLFQILTETLSKKYFRIK